MTNESRETRRRYGRQFKSMVLAQRDGPGMSVVQVAMSQGINDNAVQRWQLSARRQAAGERAKPSLESAWLSQNLGFVPVALPVPIASEAPTEVRLDIERRALSVGITWPEKAFGDLGGIVRELLK